MDKTENLHEKHPDGSVWRRFICDCGKVVYKKNLTTGTLQFISGSRKPKDIKQLHNGGVAQNKIFCEFCGMGHIVVDVVENIGLSEDYTVNKEVAK